MHILIDIDECSTVNGGCHQECINIDGSKNCACYEGFEIMDDGTNCAGMCSMYNCISIKAHACKPMGKYTGSNYYICKHSN